MWNRILFGLFIISLCLSGGSLFAVESDDVLLRWEEVAGALGYVLEVKDSKEKIILSKRISTNRYELTELDPGTYRHRVGVVNKFGKVEGYTDWAPFEVVKTMVPLIKTKKVYSAGKDESSKRIEVNGNNFLSSMKVYLKKDGKIIPARNVSVLSSNKVVADFDLDESLDLGMYDLVLENPKQKTAINPKNFVVGRDSDHAAKIANRQARINNNELPPDYYDTPYWSTMWRSSVLPGWGQDYIDEARWKLYVYPFVLLGAAGAYAAGYQDFLGARKRYYDSVQFGFLLSQVNDSELLFFYNNQTSLSNFNAAKQRLNNIQAGAGALGLFAIYNLVDAFLSVRRNVVMDEPQGIPILDSEWKLRANSSPRPTAHWEPSRLESFTHVEAVFSF